MRARASSFLAIRAPSASTTSALRWLNLLAASSADLKEAREELCVLLVEVVEEEEGPSSLSDWRMSGSEATAADSREEASAA